ncbi:MAG: nucleotidyl transferase AbiEii/AbiGii toxin family protein [Candidatus Njordarchaeia archaeon]
MNGIRNLIKEYSDSPELLLWSLRELFQKTILYMIYTSSFRKSYVFQGGTAIRMLYGSPRLSLDLDYTIFDRGIDKLKKDARFLNDKLKKLLAAEKIGVEIHREKISSDNLMYRFFLNFATENIVGRKIKIKNELVLRRKYFEPHEEILEIEYPVKTAVGIQVKNANQILCDKIAALAGGYHRKFVRWRDLFDIYWLVEKNNAKIDYTYIRSEFGSWEESSDDLKGLLTYLKTLKTKPTDEAKEALCKLLPPTLCTEKLLKKYISASIKTLENALKVLEK